MSRGGASPRIARRSRCLDMRRMARVYSLCYLRRRLDVPRMSDFRLRAHEGPSQAPSALRRVEPARPEEESHLPAQPADRYGPYAGWQSAAEGHHERNDEPQLPGLSYGREAASEGADAQVSPSSQEVVAPVRDCVTAGSAATVMWPALAAKPAA